MTTVLDAFNASIGRGQLSVVEAFEVPPRAERRLSIPEPVLNGPLGQWIRSGIGQDGSLWRHQSLAIEHILHGDNIVVATGAGSGKSLIFQIAVMQEIIGSDARALVLYPLKALLADQLLRWRELADQLGLEPGSVAELHGQVPSDERLTAVRSGRIILATPDIVQAWVMRQVSSPAIRELLGCLRFLVLDEAHIYESVFGSNVAYLLRRLIAARRRAARDRSASRSLQIIAATATISDPAAHLERLTGWPFRVVADTDDGSPTYGRTLVHVEAPEYGSAAEATAAEIISQIVEESDSSALIAFHDSRQGVERVAKLVDHDSVLPYRSGFDIGDRHRIEKALRGGLLRGVVSTSALELGIDIKGFQVGLNIGVPESRKAFRQRLGRVGRQGRAAFAVLASRYAFTRFGSRFEDYYNGSIEPSHLYLSNRFIQFAQARCLLDESETLGVETREPPPGVSWPDTFPPLFELAKPGVRRPREFDFIAQLGANAPHLNYPLRQVGEANYRLKAMTGGPDDEFENIALNQAIREAYPGATYLHLRRPMKVLEWRTTSFDRSIRLEPVKQGAPTRPLLRKTVNIGFGADEIVDGRIKSSDRGLLAEVILQVNESVEGFRIGSKAFSYRDLRQQNARMSRKQREFRTTGVVLRINDPWFSGGAKEQSDIRANIADALASLVKRERSISPNDVDSASTHIALYESGGPRRVTDTIVIYDSIYGGLRLTEPLFDELDDYISRLRKAADLAGVEAFISEEIADQLQSWAAALELGTPSPGRSIIAPEGEFVVYTPGSVVSIMNNGVLFERKLIGPHILPFNGADMLVYSYDTGGRAGAGMVPHDQVQATGNEWSLSYWNPTTKQMRPVDEDGAF